MNKFTAWYGAIAAVFISAVVYAANPTLIITNQFGETSAFLYGSLPHPAMDSTDRGPSRWKYPVSSR